MNQALSYFNFILSFAFSIHCDYCLSFFISHYHKDTAAVANRQFAIIKNPLSLRGII